MKQLITLLTVASLNSCPLVQTFAGRFEVPTRGQTVNAVLGDVSFVRVTGVMPDAFTDELLRVRIHLAYVEHLLRSRDVTHLSLSLRQARMKNLDHLRDYWMKGVFPVNVQYAGQRRPCFIDRSGNICAVGYLIEKTAGRDLAESIDAQYRYSYIADMQSDELMTWIVQSGLSLEECAMIQPEYCSAVVIPKEELRLNKTVERTTIGIGMTSVILNGILTGSGRTSYISFGIGVLSGTTGIALGTSNRANYSTVSILAGSAAILSSLVNLAFSEDQENQSTAMNQRPKYPQISIALLPIRKNETSLGLSLSWQM